MTEEVAELVLADNRNQARALTLDGLRSMARYEEFVAFVEDLVAAGRAQPRRRRHPDQGGAAGQPAARAGPAAAAAGRAPRPHEDVRVRDGHADARSRRARPAARSCVEYFPHRLQREFADHFEEHPLRREIVATAAVNHVVNCAGVTFLSRMMAGGKFGIGEVIAAYSEVDRSSGAHSLRERLKDAAAGSGVQGLLELEEALESATRDALEGKAGDAGAALEPVRARLEPA